MSLLHAEQAGRRLVILVTHLGAGGAERVSAQLAAYFADSGWLVTLVTLDDSVPDFYALSSKVLRRRLSVSGQSSGLVSALTGNLRRFWQLRAAIRAARADVVLGMTSQCGVLVVLACLGLSTRTVVAERNYPSRLRLQRAWHWLRRLLYGIADAVVVQSEPARVWIERYTRAKAHSVHVIPNAIDLPLATHPAMFGPDDLVRREQGLLLAIGRLTPQKGFDRLVTAFARLADAHPDWLLVILGEGGQRARLEELADSFGLGARVLFPGLSSDLPPWYRRADIFVLSSLFEGFPNVLLEAMAHGTPVLSVDCPTGPAELIQDGINGRLIAASDDPLVLAEALGALMDDAAQRVAMGRNAQAVTDRYSPGRVFDLWRQALQGASSGAQTAQRSR